MIKIIHAADLHLDSAFAGLVGDKAIERRAHQRSLIRDIIELGNQEQVDIILLAGDLFDGRNAYYETANALAEACSKSRARIFISPGNHDPYCKNSPYRSVHFSENVHIFKREQIERIEIPSLNCIIYGAGFETAECRAPLLQDFHADTDKCGIMVIHGEITSSASVYNPISKQMIANSGLTYLALGHVHTFDGIHRIGDTHYAYAGVPEGRGFDELGDKGILIGDIFKEKVDLHFHKLSPYNYTERIIKAENNKIPDILKMIPSGTDHEVCRLILEGVCDKPDVDVMQERLAPLFYHLAIVDRTTPARSIWEDIEQDGIKGMFLRKLRHKLDMEEDEGTQAIILRAVEYGVAALENREDVR